MAEVIPSSHSPMSTTEYPSVPRTPPPEEGKANHEDGGQTQTAGSYGVYTQVVLYPTKRPGHPPHITVWISQIIMKQTTGTSTKTS